MIHVKKLCAPGPSGQRGEHAEQMYKLKHQTFNTIWMTTIDELTTRAMKGTLPPECSWIFNTTPIWLSKNTRNKFMMQKH
ncbi:MAG: hypothetical protein ACKPKO_02640, partial [Candidatus Fonsibacter sp.]